MADETRDQARRIAELEARLEGYVRRIEAVETRKLVLARELDVAEASLAEIRALITTPDEHGITRWRIGHARKRILAIIDAPQQDAS